MLSQKFVEDLIYINKAYCFIVLSCSSFICLCYQGDAGLIEWVQKHSFLCSFWECFGEDIMLNSFLNVWYNSALKPSDPGFCWDFFFFNTDSVSVLIICLLIFSISSWLFVSICMQCLFPPPSFSICVSLDLEWISCKYRIYRSFFIHSATLCLLVGAFSPFIFKVITDGYILITRLPLWLSSKESACQCRR